MPSDEFLRLQSKRLLDQLKEKQETLGKAVSWEHIGGLRAQYNALTLSDLDSGQGNVSKAKESLCSRVGSTNSKILNKSIENFDSKTVKGQGAKKLPQGVITLDDSLHRDYGVSDRYKDGCQTEGLNNSKTCTTPVKTGSGAMDRITTPTSVRRGREIIDRNVRVETGKIHRESDYGTTMLSTDRTASHGPYGVIGRDSDLPVTESTYHRLVTGDQDVSHDHRQYPEEESNCYYKKLTDGGNDRKKVNFIKEATLKPKSILNSAGPYRSKKRNGVRYIHVFTVYVARWLLYNTHYHLHYKQTCYVHLSVAFFFCITNHM